MHRETLHGLKDLVLKDKVFFWGFDKIAQVTVELELDLLKLVHDVIGRAHMVNDLILSSIVLNSGVGVLQLLIKVAEEPEEMGRVEIEKLVFGSLAR